MKSSSCDYENHKYDDEFNNWIELNKNISFEYWTVVKSLIIIKKFLIIHDYINNLIITFYIPKMIFLSIFGKQEIVTFLCKFHHYTFFLCRIMSTKFILSRNLSFSFLWIFYSNFSYAELFRLFFHYYKNKKSLSVFACIWMCVFVSLWER